MNWSDVGKMVGKAAPLVGTALGGAPGAAIGGLVASVLGVDNDPTAVARAIEADPQALERIKQMEIDHREELTRMHLQAETTRLAEVNQTMRAEAGSDDPYVRRWRPTFGYLTALSWATLVTAIAWSIAFEPKHAGTVAQIVSAVTPMFGVALAVLGINVSKRSQDKQVAAGQQPKGLLTAIAEKIGK
ncbi:3TM-type holin [Guyparkeria halopsychrophila]|uniref:3TM-type holin n=1 Tax=Guyparkeria halopsychrophila TaxID=3139421 RepID=UPI0037C8BF3D